MSKKKGNYRIEQQKYKLREHSLNQKNRRRQNTEDHNLKVNNVIEYWQKQGQPWRTQQEINTARQAYLLKCLTTIPNIKEGKYPFKDISLTRADIEWLISEHEKKYGSIIRDEEHEIEYKGLDLRGANLRKVDLHGLPLQNLRGGLSLDEWYFSTNRNFKERDMAGIHLEEANLRDAHLEGANLNGAYLEKADLTNAYLEKADLYQTHLEKAVLCRANLRKTKLREAFLQNADFRNAFLEEANLSHAHLEKTNLCSTFLEKADLHAAYLMNADCINIGLEYANLNKAHLEEAMLPLARFGGANLSEAHLEGANLTNALFCLTKEKIKKSMNESKNMGEQVKQPLFTDIRGIFFNSATNLEDIVLEEDEFNILFADIRWGGVNLAVVNWKQLSMLGEERNARTRKAPNGMHKDKSTRLEEFQRAIRANRQLAIVLQTQGLDEEATIFSYRTQVLRRKLTWHRIFQLHLIQPIWKSRYNLQNTWFWKVFVWLKQKVQYSGLYLFYLFLDIVAGYGYKPGRSFFWYLFVLLIFTAIYNVFYHFSPLEAFLFSLTSFHGRGFFPVNNVKQHLLGDPVALLAAIEAVVGVFIEISFVAAFTQRYLGK